MRTLTPRIRNSVFGAVIVAALGFGVTTATATPRMADQRNHCSSATSPQACISCCRGYNMDAVWMDGSCSCIFMN